MTAFARAAALQEWGQATWELRSVNHRYLDITFKMPDYFREYEVEWRNLLAKTLHRGKVECHLSFIPSAKTAPALQINSNLVNQLLDAAKQLATHDSVATGMKAMELLRWPDVVRQGTIDYSELKLPLTAELTQALQRLVQNRQQEGAALKIVLEGKSAQILEQVAIVKERLPLCLEAQKLKITQRLADIQANVEKERLEQELVFYAQRMDVAEEIDRLVTHVQAVEQALKIPASGRRLDFLMQEMNREANTLAAKSSDHLVTKAAVELKVIIEQMREQIQNVE
ncbi:YicC/YloC family endoribonuclease [Candidatus Berkiella aquae]|nr:YicC/YloC family endoribonuclease [Candidatus Berkiella aquae]MCS5710058.1 YicC family protein [Candidatus Berkiella aquae]